jgi:hypothetical protein
MAGSNNFELPVYSRNVVEFVTVAVEFCNFIEKSQEISALDFSLAVNKILPLTYLKASMLPKIDSEEESSPEDFVTEEIYNFVQESISSKLGENDLDCEVPETTSQNGENTTATISEIIADIYQDLKNFSMSYRTGEEYIMTESLWICKQNFEQFWGFRLLAAQTPFHKLIYGNTDWEATKSTKEEADTSNWLISQRQQEWGNDF